MTGGLLILGAGVWVLCQVFGGKALERISLVHSTDQAGAETGPDVSGLRGTGRLADLANAGKQPGPVA